MGLFDTNDLNMDWSFDPQYVDYNPSQGLLGGISDLQGAGSAQMGVGGDFSTAYRQMLDPGSDYYKRMFGELSKSVGDTTATANLGMNKTLASRGVGGGGMAHLLGSANMNTAGESMRKGFGDIQNIGLGHAGTFGGIASGAYGSAGDIFGKAGGLLQGIDSMSLTADMSNAETFNAYQQYLRESQWNTMVQNQNAQDARTNQWIGVGGDILGAGLTVGGMMAMGPAAPAKMAIACIPEGTEIDVPNGKTKIEDLRAGDEIIGYDGHTIDLMQKHEYKEDPKVKRFLKFTFDDDSTVDLCDMHRIEEIRSKHYKVGDAINNKIVKSIKWCSGVNRSYDLLTEDRGYRISGIPVNSMIEEMMKLTNLISQSVSAGEKNGGYLDINFEGIGV